MKRYYCLIDTYYNVDNHNLLRVLHLFVIKTHGAFFTILSRKTSIHTIQYHIAFENFRENDERYVNKLDTSHLATSFTDTAHIHASSLLVFDSLQRAGIDLTVVGELMTHSVNAE